MKRPLVVLASATGLVLLSAAVASRALVGLAIGWVLLAGAAWAMVALSARSLAVERITGATEVQEGAPVRVRFAVARCRWLPVQVEIANHAGGWLPLKDGAASLELRVDRPGAYRLMLTTIRLRDPIGLFERRMLAGRVETLLVLPAPRSHPSVQLRHTELTDDPEPQGLAPYTPGTPLTRIHWPTLARGAGLQVRHLASPRGELPLVVVETAGAATPAALDWVARTAAGYILMLARNGGCRVLLPGDSSETRVIGSDAAWRSMHRRLATLGDLPPPPMPVPAAGRATVHVCAARAPALLVAPPTLPEGVLTASKCAPCR